MLVYACMDFLLSHDVQTDKFPSNHIQTHWANREHANPSLSCPLQFYAASNMSHQKRIQKQFQRIFQSHSGLGANCFHRLKNPEFWRHSLSFARVIASAHCYITVSPKTHHAKSKASPCNCKLVFIITLPRKYHTQHPQHYYLNFMSTVSLSLSLLWNLCLSCFEPFYSHSGPLHCRQLRNKDSLITVSKKEAPE